MDAWVKTAIMLLVLTIWGAAMVTWIFFQHIRPDPLTWGIPGAVYLALNPQLPRRRPTTRTRR